MNYGTLSSVLNDSRKYGSMATQETQQSSTCAQTWTPLLASIIEETEWTPKHDTVDAERFPRTHGDVARFTRHFKTTPKLRVEPVAHSNHSLSPPSFILRHVQAHDEGSYIAVRKTTSSSFTLFWSRSPIVPRTTAPNPIALSPCSIPR